MTKGMTSSGTWDADHTVYIGIFCGNIKGKAFKDPFKVEAKMAEDNNRVTASALMLIAGGILGAGLALLFAPQTGKRTRKDIARLARKTKHKAEDLVDDFIETVSDMAEVVGDKAADVLDQGKDMAYEAKKELLRALEDGQAKLEKQRARLAKLIG